MNLPRKICVGYSGDSDTQKDRLLADHLRAACPYFATKLFGVH